MRERPNPCFHSTADLQCIQCLLTRGCCMHRRPLLIVDCHVAFQVPPRGRQRRGGRRCGGGGRGEQRGGSGGRERQRGPAEGGAEEEELRPPPQEEAERAQQGTTMQYYLTLIAFESLNFTKSNIFDEILSLTHCQLTVLNSSGRRGVAVERRWKTCSSNRWSASARTSCA